MMKQYQGNGNCFHFCLATLMNLPAELIPDFIGMLPDDIELARKLDEFDMGDHSWDILYRNWLKGLGYTMDVITMDKSYLEKHAYGEYIVIGYQPDHEFRHACVYKDGQLVHNPSGGPPLERIVQVVFIRPLFIPPVEDITPAYRTLRNKR
jgi:hypothetical protein